MQPAFSLSFVIKLVQGCKISQKNINKVAFCHQAALPNKTIKTEPAKNEPAKLEPSTVPPPEPQPVMDTGYYYRPMSGSGGRMPDDMGYVSVC
jgi:hypothetical protein